MLNTRIYLYQFKNQIAIVKGFLWFISKSMIALNKKLAYNTIKITEIITLLTNINKDFGTTTFLKNIFNFKKLELNNRYKILDESLVEDKKNIFKISYCLRSLNNQGKRIVISLYKDEKGKVSNVTKEAIPSLASIYRSVNWLERENFDLYGLIYKNHPDLRRILTDYGFVGAPFRKDFPLIGYKELSYNSENGSVTYKKISLLQEYRNFDMNNSWLK
jgi:NADH:ubiquinone oxidoreductase subunit C